MSGKKKIIDELARVMQHELDEGFDELHKARKAREAWERDMLATYPRPIAVLMIMLQPAFKKYAFDVVMFAILLIPPIFITMTRGITGWIEWLIGYVISVVGWIFFLGLIAWVIIMLEKVYKLIMKFRALDESLPRREKKDED